MNDNREVIETINVDPLMRRILLADTGHHMKALQTKVNEGLKDVGGSCYLSFTKEHIDSHFPYLSVKAKQPIISMAFELAESGMKEMNSFIVNLTVDPYIVP
jgi:hypothetical protein